MTRFKFMIAAVLSFQVHGALAQAVFVTNTTLLCARPDAVQLLHNLVPPSGAGVPGSTVADPRAANQEEFRFGRCMWLSPNTSLVEIGREGPLSRVRMTGQPYPLFVETARLTTGVGATPTPKADPERDAFEQGKVATERRLMAVQQQLQLTPIQQPLFDAYAQALRAYSSDSITLDGEFTRDLPRANAVEFLQLRQRGVQFEADRLKLQLQLFSRLYGSLSPSQKTVADHLLAR